MVDACQKSFGVKHRYAPFVLLNCKSHTFSANDISARELEKLQSKKGSLCLSNLLANLIDIDIVVRNNVYVSWMLE